MVLQFFLKVVNYTTKENFRGSAQGLLFEWLTKQTKHDLRISFQG
jgi:hypothetical protein